MRYVAVSVVCCLAVWETSYISYQTEYHTLCTNTEYRVSRCRSCRCHGSKKGATSQIKWSWGRHPIFDYQEFDTTRTITTARLHTQFGSAQGKYRARSPTATRRTRMATLPITIVPGIGRHFFTSGPAQARVLLPEHLTAGNSSGRQPPPPTFESSLFLNNWNVTPRSRKLASSRPCSAGGLAGPYCPSSRADSTSCISTSRVFHIFTCKQMNSGRGTGGQVCW